MNGPDLYDIARKESGSEKWRKLLNTMERRVRFEDGFVQGWRMCEKETKERKRKLREVTHER